MTPERWEQVKAVVAAALAEEAVERPAWVARVCASDDALREEVLSLLQADTEAGDFIEAPVFEEEARHILSGQEGQSFGPYRIVREIGRGGMGTVYLAEHEETGKRVALKRIHLGLELKAIIQRFQTERRILAHLTHPHIAQLLDGGSTPDGRLYFVMEYVPGQPIDEFCQTSGLALPERLDLFRKVCSAVHFAHQNLVVHRDLKPANILVTEEGIPKLLDFGIAKLLEPEPKSTALTELGLRPMTLEVASPEQVRGGTITTASDVYSLGVLLHVLLTGASPYHTWARDREALQRAICEEDPPPPSRGVPGRDERRRLAGDLDSIVARAMRKDPQERYPSVDEMATDLARYSEGLPVVARKGTARYRIGKFARRHRWGVGVAAGFLSLILGAGVAGTLLFQKVHREQLRAQTIQTFLAQILESSDPRRAPGEQRTLREVLDVGRQQLQEGSFQDLPEARAELLDLMGRVYRQLGEHQSAEQLLSEAVTLRWEVFGADSIPVADSLQNLALVRREGNQLAEAERLLRQALENRRRQGQGETADYAAGLSDLGSLLAEQERPAAERLLQQALDLKLRLNPGEPVEAVQTLNHLAGLYQHQGRFQEAELLYQRALGLCRKASPPPQHQIADLLHNLAALREDQGDLERAEALYHQSLSLRRKVFGDRHFKVARSLNNLARVLHRKKKLAAAEELLRDARSMVDEEPLTRGFILQNLAAVLLDRGQSREAEPLAREALALFSRSPLRAQAEGLLGRCLMEQGRFQEAESALLGSYQQLRGMPGAGRHSEEEARQHIFDLYRAWGKPERAASFQPE